MSKELIGSDMHHGRRWQGSIVARFGGVLPALLTSCCSLLTGHCSPLSAQTPAAIERERSGFSTWLETAALSPYAILALQPVGAGISIGYEPADVPLPVATRGMAREERGGVVLTQGDTGRVLPRGRPVRLENFTLVSNGPPGRAVVAAYGAVRRFRAPRYYAYAPQLALIVTLEPPERHGSFRTLGPDGIETDASEAGLVGVTLGGSAMRLRVYRIGGADADEAELTIFFRDATNGKGSYPAGRFVTLDPAPGGQYRLDFNRARNPFCAYSSVYPCPAPWPGNTIRAEVDAGEQYHGVKP